jgi:cell division transport system permease protein
MNFSRIIKFALTDFSRNKGTSIAAIFVLFVTIMLVTGLFFFFGFTNYLTSEIQNKIDITAYFKEGTPEEDILNAKDQILKSSPEIRNIEYVSKEDALANFNEKHSDSPTLARALFEVGDNPFLPSLNITTSGDPAQYKELSNFIQNASFSDLIDKVDFSAKKDTIEKVYSITSNISRFGLILEGVLLILATLVVFNTLKLAIQSSKDEISTMKIVGASDWFVRGPFVVQGIIYGIVGFLICFTVSGVSAYFLSPHISAILPGFSLFSYFLTNWWIFVLIQLGFGAGVGVVSSFIAIKKYLEV